MPALDGVRGVASLVVVLFHASLIARPFADDGTARLVWQVATESPLKLGFAGTEAVQVFFVLSGLVVTLPALRAGFSWPGYYASRLVRLYLPVWAAILFAVLLVVVFPRDPSRVESGTWIINANLVTPDWGLALQEATLTVTSYDTVNTLWSLRWEVMFSLLLPLFAAVALLVRRWVWVAAVLCVVSMVCGHVFGANVNLDGFTYFPAFLLGALMAVRLDDLQAWSRARARPLLWAAVTVVSSLTLIASWWTRPFVGRDGPMSDTLQGLAGGGAAGLILVVVCSPLAQRIMQAGPLRWLGGISFSLYLVHAPILATLAFAWGDEYWPIVAVVGVPVSIVAAWLFLHAVERPSHRAARRVGRRVQELFGGASG